MKKTLLFITASLFFGAASAQVYSASDAAAWGTWTSVDLDADGNEWGVSDLTGAGTALDAQGECATSASWIAAGPLTPDNLFIGPPQDMSSYTSATLEFGWGSVEDVASGWNAEHLAVYVVTDITGISSGTFPSPVFEMTNPTGAQMNTEMVDITAEAAGQATVYIAFRHYNCTDMNFVVVDDLNLWGSAAEVDENEISVSTYPNPTVDVLNITLSQPAEMVNIYGMDGTLLITSPINGTNFSMDVSELAAGTYLYEVTSETASARSTFVKQ
jgi:hypothetical protein